MLRAVIETNPSALAQAAALDLERKTKGPRGPLHGIPIILKDNIATRASDGECLLPHPHTYAHPIFFVQA